MFAKPNVFSLITFSLAVIENGLNAETGVGIFKIQPHL